MADYIRKIDSALEKKWKNISMATWIMVILVFVLSFILIYCFAVKKEGRNADEVWSYGYANSYYAKDLCIDADGNMINMNKWVDSDVIKEYLMVDPGEEFSYDSVYFNHINDLSPPLYTIILHTVCSLFPNTYSEWYAFMINFISFIVTFIFFYKWSALLKNEKFALLCCTFYGLSVGFVDLFLYLRMYALETAFFMALIYYMIRYHKSEEKKTRWKLMLIIDVVAVPGFLTSYYFISAVGILTFLLCAYYFFLKKYKRMFILGFSMLGNLLVSIILFPAAINIISTFLDGSNQNTRELMNYNFEFRSKIITNMFINREFGIQVPYYSSGVFDIVVGIIIFVLIINIPLIFLMRKNRFISKVFDSCKYLIFNFKEIIINIWEKTNKYILILTVVFVLQNSIIGETCNLGAMGIYSVRYQLFLFPMGVFVVLYYAAGLYSFIIKKFNNTWASIWRIIMITALFLCMGNNFYNEINNSIFFFEKDTKGIPMKQVVDGNYVIFIDINAWHIMEMAPEFMDAKQYFHTYEGEYDKHRQDYIGKISEGKVVLVIDRANYETALDDVKEGFITGEGKDIIKNGLENGYNNVIDYFEELVPDTQMELMGIETIFGDDMETYIINP